MARSPQHVSIFARTIALGMSAILVPLLLGACVGPRSHDQFRRESAVSDDELKEAERYETAEVDGDSLGLHFFPSVNPNSEVSFCWFPGTPPDGLVGIEPLLLQLRAHGDVLVFDRLTSGKRTFDDLAELHAEVISELRSAGRIREKVVFIAHSYGAQVAMRTALRLDWLTALALGDRFFSVFLAPCLGPRDARRGEILESDLDLVYYARHPLVTWGAIRASIGHEEVRCDLKKLNPNDHIPDELVRATCSALHVEHGLQQASSLTKEELSWPDVGNPCRDMKVVNYPMALAERSFAILGSHDPACSLLTQGRHARTLGIKMPEEAPDYGHHGHYIHSDVTWNLVSAMLRDWKILM